MKEYRNSDIAHLVDEYVHNERNRMILKRRLIDGVIFEDLSYEFNMSVRQIKTIVYREQDRVFRHLD